MVPETKFKGRTRLGSTPVANVNEKARGDIFFPPNLYITHSMEKLPLSFGIGFNSIYPLAKRWKSNSPFRDEIKEIAIKPFNIQPTVAYRLDRFNLSFAAGIDYTYAMVWLEKSPYMGTTGLGEMEIEGDGDGWGYNLGILWKPIRQVSIGAAYRSEIKLDIDGDADFGSQLPGMGFSGDASTSITLPDTWSFGIAVKPVERLTLEFDVDRFGWSSYDELKIKFDSRSTLGPESVADKDWKDCWAYRFGVQYSVTDNFDVRAGYAYDETPQPERTVGPELPDADRHNYTVGFGYKIGQATFDVAYMFVDFKDRKVDNSIQTGTYKSEAHLIAANLTYRF